MARTGYQRVGPSPWPISVSFAVLGVCSGFLIFISEGSTWMFYLVFFVSFSLMIFSLSNWWLDLVKESTYLGEWSSYVVRTYAIGFRLFIISEIFFFLALFGAYIYYGVGEMSIQGVGFWPPRGVKPLHPGKVAFLNTGLLVLSSGTVNWAYYAMKAHNSVPYSGKSSFFMGKGVVIKTTCRSLQNESLFALGLTILLGVCFTYFQAVEYYWCSFTFADGIYGSIFYLLTGFHGLHVVIGTIFLIVCWFRLLCLHFSFKHSYAGFWAAVWYWHFVDGVWVAVYFLVYIWSYWGWSPTML